MKCVFTYKNMYHYSADKVLTVFLQDLQRDLRYFGVFNSM